MIGVGAGDASFFLRGFRVGAVSTETEIDVEQSDVELNNNKQDTFVAKNKKNMKFTYK
jgi:hypothetical protein